MSVSEVADLHNLISRLCYFIECEFQNHVSAFSFAVSYAIVCRVVSGQVLKLDGIVREDCSGK